MVHYILRSSDCRNLMKTLSGKIKNTVVKSELFSKTTILLFGVKTLPVVKSATQVRSHLNTGEISRIWDDFP